MTQTKVPATTANGKAAVKIHAPKKLDIACGQRKREGYKGIDLSGDADILHDLFEFPWPIKTSSVHEATCSHFIEHVPHWRPGWTKDGWWLFFDEVHRIMRADAVIEIIHPYVKHERAFWDPTHVRYIHETTWYYLNKDWRVAQGIDHYGGQCDFEVITVDGVGIANEQMTRNLEAQTFARNHYWNVIPDLRILLRTIK